MSRDLQLKAALDALWMPSGFPEIDNMEVIRKIADGGMGTVYEAKHRILDRHVAVKVIKRSLVIHDLLTEQFLKEGRCQAGLRHPNIVVTFDAKWFEWYELSTPCLIMEYVDGLNLHEHVARYGCSTSEVVTDCTAV